MYKVGDTFNIHSYKHDGNPHKSWDKALFLYEDEDYYIFGNNKTLVTENDGRTWKTKEPAIIFFSKKNWFSIIAQLKSNGIYYYCDLASPCVIEEHTVKYIDYDLDLRVFPDFSFKILDKGEYQYHKRIMAYPNEIDLILKDELTKLIDMVRNNIFPFIHTVVLEFNEKYKFLDKMSLKKM